MKQPCTKDTVCNAALQQDIYVLLVTKGLKNVTKYLLEKKVFYTKAAKKD
jgi:hypothetical protein